MGSWVAPLPCLSPPGIQYFSNFNNIIGNYNAMLPSSENTSELKYRYFGAFRTTNKEDTLLVKNILSVIEQEMLTYPDTPNYIRNKPCMENFILNLIRAVQIDETILYRRDINFYDGSRHPNLCSTIPKYADILISLGYMTGCCGDKPTDRVALSDRKMSSFRPTQKFFDMLVDRGQNIISSIQLSRDLVPLQLTRKEKIKTPYIDIYTGKTLHKTTINYTTLPIKNKEYQIYHRIGDINIRYKLTVSAMEKEMEAYNNCLLTHNISFPEGAFVNEQDKLTWKYGEHCKTYCRKFTNSMSRGGRYFSHGTQNISGLSRRNMLIDGSPVVECDYSALHAKMLYDSLGLTIPDGDLYLVEGFEKYRDLCKIGLLIMVNAKDEVGGRKAIWEHVREERLDISYDDLTILVNAFIEKHKPIAHLFFRDTGMAMQSLDSRIMSFIIKDFVKLGKPILSYHDSGICKVEDRELLISLMQKYYKKVIGVETAPAINSKYGTRDVSVAKLSSCIGKTSALRTEDGLHEIIQYEDKNLDFVENICLGISSSNYFIPKKEKCDGTE
jgi:hypothetical protein